MKQITIMISALLLLTWPASAQTAGACTPEKESLQQPEPQDFVQEEVYNKRRQKMVSLDVNCNGVVELKEWATTITEMFQAADLDHNNNLSADEQHAMADAYTTRTEKVIGSVTILQSREIQTAQHNMNTDGDGMITIDEFVNYYAMVFGRMDKNRDNVIDINEFNERFEGVRRVRN